MNNVVRIIVVVVCIIALYYLVVTLARSVGKNEASAPPAAVSVVPPAP
jgi:hypothetical protein